MTQTAAPLYALRLLAPGQFQMAKFSMPDFNVEAVYNLTAKGSGYACDCPASARMVKLRPCKHQRAMPYMLGAVNTNRFFEPSTGRWVEPLAPSLADLIKADARCNCQSMDECDEREGCQNKAADGFAVESPPLPVASEASGREGIEQPTNAEVAVETQVRQTKAEVDSLSVQHAMLPQNQLVAEPPKLKRRV